MESKDENTTLYFQLFFKGTDILYYGSKNVSCILSAYEMSGMKDGLELRIVTERNPKSCWIW